MSNEREHIDEKLTDLERLRAGISKREYFAAMAMQGYIATSRQFRDESNGEIIEGMTPKIYAAIALEAADALLKALEEKR